MSAINYGSNDILNIGLNVDRYNLHDEEDTESEVSFMYEKVTEILEEYSFYYFNVVIKSGYYEGFYLDIECKEDCYYDSYLDKLEALKELSQLHTALKRCIWWGLVVYNPGWCTGWYNEEESKAALKQAIKDAKASVKSTSTFNTYYREELQYEH